MTLLADVVTASRLVSETSSRSRKVAILADLLRALDPSEVPICVGFLSGVPRQGRVGVGYRTIYAIDAQPAAHASLTVTDVDRAIDQIEQTTGPGSADRRRTLLDELLARATAAEAPFVKRLFTGELRQGALAGVMADAVAKAAGVPGEIARRALMLSGDLSRMAEIAIADGEAGLRAVGFEIFRPILPMLASTAASIAEAVSSFELSSVEWKLDGIRIQIHRRGDEVRIYTRNLNDITPTLPGIVEAVRRLPVSQVVLDGEALWMRNGSPAAFQDTVSLIDSDAPPEDIVTFLFDLLHLDGEDLLDAPLARAHHETGSARAGAHDPPRAHLRSAGGRTRPRGVAARRPRGRRGQGRRVRRTRRAGVAGHGARSSRSAPTTSSCSAPNGATGAGKAGSRTFISAPATPPATASS